MSKLSNHSSSKCLKVFKKELLSSLKEPSVLKIPFLRTYINRTKMKFKSPCWMSKFIKSIDRTSKMDYPWRSSKDPNLESKGKLGCTLLDSYWTKRIHSLRTRFSSWRILTWSPTIKEIKETLNTSFLKSIRSNQKKVSLLTNLRRKFLSSWLICLTRSFTMKSKLRNLI